MGLDGVEGTQKIWEEDPDCASSLFPICKYQMRKWFPWTEQCMRLYQLKVKTKFCCIMNNVVIAHQDNKTFETAISDVWIFFNPAPV